MTNNQLILIQTSSETKLIASYPEQVTQLTGVTPVNIENLQHHKPDAHWLLVSNNQQLIARCSLWWKNTPPYEAHRLGTIGHYAAADATAGQQLLHHACEQLKAQSCTIAVGPMDGNTWRNYRLITERGTEPIFFLEPNNSEHWPDHFIQQGFTSLAQYSSTINTNLSQVDSRIQRVSDRLSQIGVKIRPINLQQFTAELHSIYQVSLISFRKNFLYTPIEETEFITQYSQIIPYIRPELVLMAEHNEQLIGFLFAVPDWLQAERGAINTVIIKTVAILPERIYAGLGSLLVSRCHQIAQEHGFTHVIHALMHDDNNSRNVNHYNAKTMRRYTLFGKIL